MQVLPINMAAVITLMSLMYAKGVSRQSTYSFPAFLLGLFPMVRNLCVSEE
jgi:hypothetical protein